MRLFGQKQGEQSYGIAEGRIGYFLVQVENEGTLLGAGGFREDSGGAAETVGLGELEAGEDYVGELAEDDLGRLGVQVEVEVRGEVVAAAQVRVRSSHAAYAADVLRY